MMEIFTIPRTIVPFPKWSGESLHPVPQAYWFTFMFFWTVYFYFTSVLLKFFLISWSPDKRNDFKYDIINQYGCSHMFLEIILKQQKKLQSSFSNSFNDRAQWWVAWQVWLKLWARNLWDTADENKNRDAAIHSFNLHNTCYFDPKCQLGHTLCTSLMQMEVVSKLNSIDLQILVI